MNVTGGRPEAGACEVSFESFFGGFRRSRRGNLWREYGGQVVTVFRHKDGRYGWSVDDGDRTRFPPWGRDLASELDALDDLWHEVAGLD